MESGSIVVLLFKKRCRCYVAASFFSYSNRRQGLQPLTGFTYIVLLTSYIS